MRLAERLGASGGDRPHAHLGQGDAGLVTLCSGRHLPPPVSVHTLSPSGQRQVTRALGLWHMGWGVKFPSICADRTGWGARPDGGWPAFAAEGTRHGPLHPPERQTLRGATTLGLEGRLAVLSGLHDPRAQDPHVTAAEVQAECRGVRGAYWGAGSGPDRNTGGPVTCEFQRSNIRTGEFRCLSEIPSRWVTWAFRAAGGVQGRYRERLCPPPPRRWGKGG